MLAGCGRKDYKFIQRYLRGVESARWQNRGSMPPPFPLSKVWIPSNFCRQEHFVKSLILKTNLRNWHGPDNLKSSKTKDSHRRVRRMSQITMVPISDLWPLTSPFSCTEIWEPTVSTLRKELSRQSLVSLAFQDATRKCVPVSPQGKHWVIAGWGLQGQA